MRAFKTKSPLGGIVIILLGRPGSGKDTQAKLLVKKFGLVHIVSSKVIRRTLISSKKSIRFNGEAYSVEKERRLQRNGFLNTFNFVVVLIKNEIRRVARSRKGIILSASPRALIELREELPLLEKFYGKKNIYFFHIAISPKEVYIRNLKRQRKDLPELDTKKIIKKRLAVFMKNTWPVVKLLKKQKRIININGEQSIAKIHREILKVLDNIWKLQSKVKKRLES